MTEFFKFKCDDPNCYACNNSTPEDFFKQGLVVHGPRVGVNVSVMTEGYQPKAKIPGQGNLDTSKPPQSGSGVIKPKVKILNKDHANAKNQAMEILAFHKKYNDENINLARCYLDLLERGGELEKALEFYANWRSWDWTPGIEALTMIEDDSEVISYIENDGDTFVNYFGGKRARAALIKYREELKTSKMGSE